MGSPQKAVAAQTEALLVLNQYFVHISPPHQVNLL
jgi:hypothetical protein